MLWQRIVFGALMIGAIVALLIVDHNLDGADWMPGHARGLLFTALVALLVILASLELGRMLRSKGMNPLTGAGAVIAALVAISPFLATLHEQLVTLPVLAAALGVLLVFFAQALLRRSEDALPNIAATLLIVGYLGVVPMFAVWMRIDPRFGTWAVLVFIAAIKCTDIGAYFVGKVAGLGRHKIIAWLSPGKSWEGLGGGVLLAIGATLAIALPLDVLNWWKAIVFAVVMALVGQLADLAESLLKRDSGQKDSGSIVPGFGGVLDVLDSPLGAAPIAFLLFCLLAA